MSLHTMVARFHPLSSSYANISDTMPSSWSGRLKDDERDEYQAQPTVEELSRLPGGPLTDEDRLRMLGYDVSLGRPLGFWSSAGMNLCHLSFIYEFISQISLYSHEGPLLFVSRSLETLTPRLSGFPSSSSSTSAS